MIATIGSILLALCGMPEAYKCYKTKSCTLGWPMLIMWFVGEVLLIIFAFQTVQYFLLLNYFSNLAFLLIMMRYKTD
jgi:uncharacterized protein with PQ loop repeat